MPNYVNSSAPVATVPPGLEARFRAMAKQIKVSASYNPAIGTILGIEAGLPVAPDLTIIQPTLTLQLTSGQGGVDVARQQRVSSQCPATRTPRRSRPRQRLLSLTGCHWGIQSPPIIL